MDRWQTEGQPLQDARLRARISTVAAATAEELAAPELAVRGGPYGFADAGNALGRAFERVCDVLARPCPDPVTVHRRAERLRTIAVLQRELAEAEQAHRRLAVASVQQALTRLRAISSTAQMIDRIPVELCRCGFSRAIISRVDGARWIPESAHFDGEAQWTAQIRGAGQRLDRLAPETEVVRRRAPLIVDGVLADRGPFAETGPHSYVAAPIMPEGRVIGLLHADCGAHPREVDEFDRDLLAMLADGVGCAYARTLTMVRQRRLAAHLNQVLSALGQDCRLVADSELQLARSSPEAAVACVRPALPAESRLRTLLTPRQLEIAELLADGKTNGQIATELSIGPQTAKTHVSAILRRLRAANRAEAVKKYTTLRGADRARATDAAWGVPASSGGSAVGAADELAESA
ncbi:MAG TPA: LuxR C-terminal-related transcriptional regulator [Solirubrobacteraceae bacterium]|nr:LuxR C-terminal-related transcriptional regulator [Solirubrobacteraceae bacterium]